MEYEARLKESFCCPKCRCREASVRKVSISKTSLPKIIESDKYIFVTCTSCGLTEIYDLKVYAKATETKEGSVIIKNSVPNYPSPFQKSS